MTDPKVVAREKAKEIVDAYCASRYEVMPDSLRLSRLEDAIIEAILSERTTAYEDGFAKGQEKKASCVCTATKVGDAYCELHRPMFERAKTTAYKAGMRDAEQLVLSELGHINNNSQRAYSWHEIQELVVKLRTEANKEIK